MSTRSAIGLWHNKEENEAFLAYHHSDGYPTGLGQFLWEIHHKWFKPNAENFGFENSVAFMGMYLALSPWARAGWSFILGTNFECEPSWNHPIYEDKFPRPEDYYETMAPKTYFDRAGEEFEPHCGPENIFDTAKDSWMEWMYILDPDTMTMDIFKVTYTGKSPVLVAVVDMTTGYDITPEGIISVGENLPSFANIEENVNELAEAMAKDNTPRWPWGDGETIREMYGPAVAITDPDEAKAYYDALVDHKMETLGVSQTAAEEIINSNLGYVIGYYGPGDRKRAYALYFLSHPITGATE